MPEPNQTAAVVKGKKLMGVCISATGLRSSGLIWLQRDIFQPVVVGDNWQALSCRTVGSRVY